MAFQEIKNIQIKGIAACVPEHIENNRTSKIFEETIDADKFVETTGIEKRHTVNGEVICTSDLCLKAAEALIASLNWDKSEIDCLVFVTQTPDYILPATSCILQNRLGLSTECFAIDISLGCSGWVYGLSTIGSLLSSGNFKKGLLLVGDTVTVTKSNLDKSTYPLFGDAGTATALEFKEGADGLKIHTATDGKGFESIIIKDGGFRHFFNENSLKVEKQPDGAIRNNLQSYLNGQDVFIFGISKAPKSILGLIEKYKINKEEIDYLLLHQANFMMNDKIRKKVNIEENKVPYSLNEFGNTSSASIPLTLVTRLSNEMKSGKNKIMACGFGVGLSWGSAYFETENLCCPELIIY
jgi:3-oxoacyl-[acyl-carrier-protein] synthase-3